MMPDYRPRVTTGPLRVDGETRYPPDDAGGYLTPIRGRRDHECHACGAAIPAGDVYLCWLGGRAPGGGVRYHLDCALQLWGNPTEGAHP